MDYEWHSLQNDKYKYQSTVFSETQFGKRFSRLQHQYMLIAVASFGGPIAITSDKNQILTLREDDPSIQNIVIFNNEGQISNRIKINKPFQNVVIALQFLLDQYLLAIFRKGQIWIIDPYNAEVKKLNIVGLYEKQQICQAKVFQNGFAALTSLRRFIYVMNAFQPKCSQFVSCEQQLKESEQPLHWTVFSPKTIVSQKVQLHLAHPTTGIIQVIQGQGKRYFFNQEKATHIAQNKLPNIKGIKYISQLSPNKKLVSYFSVQPLFKQNPMNQIPANLRKKQQKLPPPVPYGFAYRLIICPSLNSDAIDPSKFKMIELPFVKQNTHLNFSQQPISIKWCGNKALILQFQNQQLYLCSIQGEFIRIQKDRGDKQKWTYLKEEVDGTRIITKKSNKILRQIPQSYISIFQSFSQQPGALLYSAFQAFEDEAPLQDDQIRKDKNKLKIAVQQCIKASRFQLNYQIVSKLMRAATYGKAFLPPNLLPNNIIFQSTKLLRVVHHLRMTQRYITLDQFQSLKDDHMLKILLRYRQHYLAFEIYNYLKKDQNFRVKIYTDWACCKVQNHDESQDDICQEIRFKLLNQKGISFTQIAHKSIQIGRSQLAMKLLQFEPSLSKKVPLLLWIGNRQNLQNCYKFYQKGIQDALKSRDLNLLFLAIRKILSSQKITEFQMFELFSKHPQGIYAIINYYRLFDGVGLIRFYNFIKDQQKITMQYIRLGIIDRKYENCQKLLFTANEQLKQLAKQNNNNDWRKGVFQNLFNHFCQFTKHNPQIKYKNQKIKPVTLAKQLQFFISKGDSDAVDQMKKQFDISDKRAIMAKIKVLIQTSKYQDLLTFVQRHQKKFKIPVQLIADFLFQKRETAWGMKMMARIPDKQKQEQYTLLQRIGRIKQAIQLAADRKDMQALEDIQSTLIDATLMALVNQKMMMLKRK